MKKILTLNLAIYTYVICKSKINEFCNKEQTEITIIIRNMIVNKMRLHLFKVDDISVNYKLGRINCLLKCTK